jgi:hypothetical protein
MGLLTTCPSCGLSSDEIRCPRCNALKVVGCDGRCSACAMKGAETCDSDDRTAERGVDLEATNPPTFEEPA